MRPEGTVVSMESVSMSWILDAVPATTADKVVEEKMDAFVSKEENKEKKVDGEATKEKSSEPIEEMKENSVEAETKEAKEQTVHRPAHTLNNINFKIKKGETQLHSTHSTPSPLSLLDAHYCCKYIKHTH